MKKIIIIGAGTGALEVQGIIEDINSNCLTYELMGLLDDNPQCQGNNINGMKVLGTLELAGKFPNVKYIFAIGSLRTQSVRKDIMSRLNLNSIEFETIIHPTALINRSVKIGNGCIIHPRVTIANEVSLGDFVVTAVASTIGPYSKIGNYSMITSHVLVLSSCKIGESVFIGSNTCVTENVTIGNLARIGVGSIVGRNVNEKIFAMGNPLRLLGPN
jgi:sugar O-acyltransferase (sialic acid O-acetyltransferase NeuD family)